MKIQLVTPEKPVSILDGVFQEYIKDKIVVDCGHIILVRKGSATLKVNFREVQQKKDVVVILFPGDAVMVENVSPDFEIEYMVYTELILNYALVGLKSFSIETFKEYYHSSSKEISILADSLFNIINASIGFGTVDDATRISVYQLSAFFTAYHAYLVSTGVDVGHYSSRSKELFAKFIQLLHDNFKESRNVAYYADAMNVTPRYLTKIVTECTGSSAKKNIDEYVIMQIKLVILNTDDAINDIAWRFKFENFSFFCDYFKRHTGLTPNEYRNKYSRI